MLATLKLRTQTPATTGETPLPSQPADVLARLMHNRHFQPVLMASRPGQVASRKTVGGSILTHFGMGALVVFVSIARPDRPPTMDEQSLIYIPTALAPTAEPPMPIDEMIRPPAANPPPKGFQTIPTPTVIPTAIPPIDLSEQPLDPRNYTGTGVEGGVADGVVGGTGEVDLSQPVGPANGIFGEETADARFTKAKVARQGMPRYPPILRRARVEGVVVVRFVIDTLGRVEPNSIEVLESSRPAFQEPAVQAILETRFIPARFGSANVRQLTNQRITFQVAK